MKNFRSVVGEQRALSVREACKYASVGRTSFYKLVKSGQIRARKCGGRTVLLVDELDQALESLPLVGRAK